MNKRQTYEQANKVFDKAVKLEQDFGEFFTGLFSVLWFMSLLKIVYEIKHGAGWTRAPYKKAANKLRN